MEYVTRSTLDLISKLISKFMLTTTDTYPNHFKI